MSEPTHTEHEDHGWTISIPDHPRRSDSPEYLKSRAKMNELAKGVDGFYYGAPPYQDHHGGALWLKDDQGWFMVRNLAGMEWSSQFAADPAKVDALRRNAQRLYAGFPGVAEELGIRSLLDTPITDAGGVAAWTDSICNASVPLPVALHTGIVPHGGGAHHYPAPVTEIQTFKHDDFSLWVIGEDGYEAAVLPVAHKGSGRGEVHVAWAHPSSKLHEEHLKHRDAGTLHVLPEDHPLAVQAFAQQKG